MHFSFLAKFVSWNKLFIRFIKSGTFLFYKVSKSALTQWSQLERKALFEKIDLTNAGGQTLEITALQ